MVNAIDNDKEAAVPFVQINIPAGSLDDDKKRAMISKVTDAVVEAEGVEAVRRNTWVHLIEVPDGGWGMAGNAITLAQMQAALGQTHRG
jgi:4-oxalocrotonate tautomerase